MLIDNENRRLDEIFLAIYFNDLEKVLEIKSKHPRLYAKKEHFKIDAFTVFDLRYLSLFNQIIWSDTNWRSELQPLAEVNRNRVSKMISFWETESDSFKKSKPLQYNRYLDHFDCEDPADTETVILETVSKYVNRGFREIDAKLFNRVECFDFVGVKSS